VESTTKGVGYYSEEDRCYSAALDQVRLNVLAHISNITHVLSVQSISGNVSGVSAHSMG